MGLGVAALSTNRKDDPAASGALVATANGVGENPAGTAVLGKTLGGGADPSDLTNNREIALGGNTIVFSGPIGAGGQERITFSSLAISMQSDAGLSGAPTFQLQELSTGGALTMGLDNSGNFYLTNAASFTNYFRQDALTETFSFGSLLPDANYMLTVDQALRVFGPIVGNMFIDATAGGVTQLTGADGRKVFTNTNAANGYDLPFAAMGGVGDGIEFTFVVAVDNGNSMSINAPAGAVIWVGSQSGTNINSTVPGSVIRLIKANGGNDDYIVFYVAGSWLLN